MEALAPVRCHPMGTALSCGDQLLVVWGVWRQHFGKRRYEIGTSSQCWKRKPESDQSSDVPTPKKECWVISLASAQPGHGRGLTRAHLNSSKKWC